MDPPRYTLLADQVLGGEYTETVHAKARTLVAASPIDGAVLAVSPAEKVAYRRDFASGALLVVVGCPPPDGQPGRLSGGA